MGINYYLHSNNSKFAIAKCSFSGVIEDESKSVLRRYTSIEYLSLAGEWKSNAIGGWFRSKEDLLERLKRSCGGIVPTIIVAK